MYALRLRLGRRVRGVVDAAGEGAAVSAHAFELCAPAAVSLSRRQGLQQCAVLCTESYGCRRELICYDSEQ